MFVVPIVSTNWKSDFADMPGSLAQFQLENRVARRYKFEYDRAAARKARHVGMEK